MKKFRFQKAFRWLMMFLIIFYQFTLLNNNLTIVNAIENPTLTFNLGTGHGTVSGYNNDTAQTINSGASLLYNTSVTLRATPEIGYILGGWDGAPSDATENNGTLSFKMPNTNTTVTANMVECSNNLTLNADPPGLGTVTGYKNASPSDTVTSGESIPVRTSVTLTATPTTGYKFGSWEFNPPGEGNKPNYVTSDTVDATELSITMPATPAIITAHFVPENYTLNFPVDPSNSGTTSGYNTTLSQLINSEASVTYGNQVTLTALPGIGYLFSGWETSPNIQGVDLTSQTLSFTMPGSNATATAHMVACNCILNLNADSSGSGTIEGYKNAITSDTVTSGEIIPVRTPITLTATPATGYEFDKWEFSVGGDEPSYASIDGNKLSITMPNTPISVTAHFKIINYNLILGLDPSEGGVINDENGNTVEPGSLFYNSGSKINLTAKPKSGYKFKQWSGNYVNGFNTENVQFNMPNSNVTLTAVFEKDGAAYMPKTSDDFNVHPYIITMMVSATLYLMLKISTQKTSKKLR